MNQFYGLIGETLSHSISPLIHQAIFDILKRPAHYQLFEVERIDLEDAVSGLLALGSAGANVTIPYKTEVIQYLDALSPEAIAIGAVNSIAFKNRTAIGYNTDYFGFGMMLERYGIKANGLDALVLGYGGAAKAVIRFLLDNEINSITVALRDTSCKTLTILPDEADKITSCNYQQLLHTKGGDLIINCTPCGMFPNIAESPIVVDVLKKYHAAIDLIYNPLETLFLKHAATAGLKTVNGLYMLVCQAVAAQEIWNDTSLTLEEIEKIYNIVVEYMMEESL